jgi:phosphohistidine phosphatase
MKVYILRHGEAGTAASDGERALTSKGLEQALQAGRLLQSEQAQRLLYSPKLRTRQTAEQVLSLAPELSSQESLNLVPPATLADVAAELEILQEAGVERVILVSHLPMVAELTAWLTHGDSSEYSFPGYPPAGIVALDMDYVGAAAANFLWYAFPPNFEQRRQ